MANTINVEQIKRLTIKALTSEDQLMEMLVLKGGNAIDLLQPQAQGKLSRASYDLDFSIETDFGEDLENIKTMIEKAIRETFSEIELIVFDYSFTLKPKTLPDGLKDFWGGYYIVFKLITVVEYNRLEGNLEKIRRGAIVVRPNQSSKVEIEISKFEYVADKIEMEMDGHSFYIYSPQMIVFEKVRAICQQLPGYSAIIPQHSPRPRARDFYDIHLICEQYEIMVNTAASEDLLKNIFDAKKVPLDFMREIGNHTDIHRQDWQNVVDTLPATERATVENFDFYLSFVLGKFKPFTSR
jgi:predicted nucleotidyltransferase component of viral defense system